MTNAESVCAIVLDYRGAEKTKQCLLSLRNQALKKVYVLDNSELESASRNLKQVIDQLRLQGVDYEVELLCAGKNLGFAKGINFVLSHDQASRFPHDYYLLLNNDAVAGPSLVKQLRQPFKQDSDIALAAPRIISKKPGWEYGVWYHRYLGLLLFGPGRFRFHYLTGCCLLFSRELVSNQGLFDEAFFMYGEDAELGWRLSRQGRKMILVENAYVEHDLGPSAERTSFFYEYHIARGHLLLSLKTWLRPAETPVLIATKYLGLASRAIIRSLRYRSVTPLNALLLACFPIRVRDP
jgi:N-acetylglucosaminyl-diphospho-decaprenol L-rhamnosyltransferase